MSIISYFSKVINRLSSFNFKSCTKTGTYLMLTLSWLEIDLKNKTKKLKYLLLTSLHQGKTFVVCKDLLSERNSDTRNPFFCNFKLNKFKWLNLFDKKVGYLLEKNGCRFLFCFKQETQIPICDFFWLQYMRKIFMFFLIIKIYWSTKFVLIYCPPCNFFKKWLEICS